MNPRIIVAVLLTLSAGGAVGWVGWNLWVARTSAAARTTLMAQRRELESQLQKRQGTLTALRAKLPTGAAAQARPAAPESRSPGSLSELLADPKAHALHFAKERIELLQSHAPFFRTRGLSKEQAEKLCDAIVAQRIVMHDLTDISRTRDIPIGDKAMQVPSQRASQEFEVAARDVLGADGYAQFLEFRASLPVRTLVGRIAGATTLDGFPLQRDQAERLVQVLIDAGASQRSGRNADTSKIDWKIAEARAKDFLSPEQLEVLRLERGGASPATMELLRAVFQAADQAAARQKR